MSDNEAAAAALAALPPLREVIARHGLSARRAFGQNFLLDLNLTGRIARAAGPLAGKTVVEIGPGPGGLTRALLAGDAAEVVAVEKDRRCLEALQEVAAVAGPRLVLQEGDAMATDIAACGSPPRVIVANLPYNISTQLLLRWLSALAADAGVLEQMVLMFQAEVADRLLAAPNSKDYGRLTVVTQWLCEVTRLFNIPSRAFTPPPKVNSTLLSIKPRPAPLAPAEMTCLERVTAAAFGQRRKMLRQSLKSLGLPVAALLDAAGIDGSLRAEDLSIADFCSLARLIQNPV
ncbi:MAG TPA: 16S rRNA (adenine(1518)-N(6)/adenine(1519)-N(6))-dimethyltransferase RsmA [Kiloniellaceae bacterium]|nr:16S rRNA (adenine(1518)-N(6)/adenine(1519)-N(6))-dimethyltransferase RsmA [Kiloniellaceae bacterium]